MLAGVRSLGYRTDLALLTLGGSTLEQRDDHVLVRTPDNPLHWWGNFLLLPRAPAAEDDRAWLDRFAAEFPDAAPRGLRRRRHRRPGGGPGGVRPPPGCTSRRRR